MGEVIELSRFANRVTGPWRQVVIQVTPEALEEARERHARLRSRWYRDPTPENEQAALDAFAKLVRMQAAPSGPLSYPPAMRNCGEAYTDADGNGASSPFDGGDDDAA